MMNAPVPREQLLALTLTPKGAGAGLPACAIPPLSASSLEAYMHTVNAIPVLSVEQERSLAAKACCEQDRAAAQTLVLSNLRFDPAVGVRLVSFAVHWIKAQIHEYILRNWRIVKLGTTKAQRRLFFNLRKNRRHIGWINRSEAE